MSLIEKYGEMKKNQAQNRIITNLLKSGMRAEFIARTADIPLSRVGDIERQLEAEK